MAENRSFIHSFICNYRFESASFSLILFAGYFLNRPVTCFPCCFAFYYLNYFIRTRTISSPRHSAKILMKLLRGLTIVFLRVHFHSALAVSHFPQACTTSTGDRMPICYVTSQLIKNFNDMLLLSPPRQRGPRWVSLRSLCNVSVRS